MAACRFLLPLLAAAAMVGCSTPATLTRHANANPTSPTSRAVEVAGGSLVFVSGQTSEPAQPQAAQYSAAYWGDTEAQALTVLRKIDSQLQSLGLTMADVLKMNVYLVGDPALQGRMDGAGWARAYGRYFGTAQQPARPARTTVQIAGLGLPGMLVEIEVIALRR